MKPAILYALRQCYSEVLFYARALLWGKDREIQRWAEKTKERIAAHPLKGLQ